MQKNQKLLYPLLVLCFLLVLVGFWLGRRSVSGVILTTERSAPVQTTEHPAARAAAPAPADDRSVSFPPTEGTEPTQEAERRAEQPLPGQRSAAPAQDGRIDLNTATLEELMTLPNIGQTRGQRILDYRAANGPFRSTAELMNVYGIGEGIYAGLRDLVYVEEADEDTDH